MLRCRRDAAALRKGLYFVELGQPARKIAAHYVRVRLLFTPFTMHDDQVA